MYVLLTRCLKFHLAGVFVDQMHFTPLLTVSAFLKILSSLFVWFIFAPLKKAALTIFNSKYCQNKRKLSKLVTRF